MTQQICIELLSKGYVRSFVDFFNMTIEKKHTVEYTFDNLNHYKKLLVNAEEHARAGKGARLTFPLYSLMGLVPTAAIENIE